MPVGFRSVLHADPGQRLIDGVIEHMNHWMAGKYIDVDAAARGRHQLDDGGVITIIGEEHEGGRIYRWMRQHSGAPRQELRRLTISAVDWPEADGWLWVEIETQASIPSAIAAPFMPMSVPRVLRMLLSSLSFRDGRTDITAEPQWITSNHLPDIMDYLADETRRGAVYVASQGSRPSEHFTQWITEITWQVVGLGTVFLLDDDVTQEFNEMVGASHAVPTGAVRTYLPNVALDDPDDPQRHKILGAARIAQTEPRRLAGMLGHNARLRAAVMDLSPEVRELDRHLYTLEETAEPAPRRANLRAVPPTADASGAAILAKLDSLENEIRALRDELRLRYTGRHRQLSVS